MFFSSACLKEIDLAISVLLFNICGFYLYFLLFLRTRILAQSILLSTFLDLKRNKKLRKMILYDSDLYFYY